MTDPRRLNFRHSWKALSITHGGEAAASERRDDDLDGGGLVDEEIGEGAFAIVAGVGIAIGQMLQEFPCGGVLLDPLRELPVFHVASFIAAIVVGIAGVDDDVAFGGLKQRVHVLREDSVFQ